jgi:hypothetical protein
MGDTIQLDYANGHRSWSVLAIIAVVLGFGSGPIMVILVRLSGIAYGISEVGSAIAVAVGTAIAAYCIVAFALARRRHLRGRSLALIGLVATVLWTIGLISLFCYVETQLT